MAAQRGFFAYNLDYVGVGESFRPADGREATFEAQIDAVGKLVQRIRSSRQVDAVDLVGEGFGAAIATELAAEPGRVRSVTMSAQIYREVAAGPLLDPGFVALLESSPDGYFFLPAEGSLIFLVGTPQPVVDYVLATQGGTYPIDNFLVATDRPFYDPAAALAPALVLYGLTISSPSSRISRTSSPSGADRAPPWSSIRTPVTPRASNHRPWRPGSGTRSSVSSIPE